MGNHGGVNQDGNSGDGWRWANLGRGKKKAETEMAALDNRLDVEIRD